jgi:hypothetical protein
VTINGSYTPGVRTGEYQKNHSGFQGARKSLTGRGGKLKIKSPFDGAMESILKAKPEPKSIKTSSAPKRKKGRGLRVAKSEYV